MDRLPDEVLVEILDYLEHEDIVSAQRISPQLLKLARDNTLWKLKCFEKAPSAVKVLSQPSTLATLTGALGGLSLSDPPATSSPRESTGPRPSRRAKAAADWDCTDPTETIDWYSEYIARNAPLHAKWNFDKSQSPSEVRGVAALSGGTRAVGPLEDGSFAIWDISLSGEGQRSFRELNRAKAGTLFKTSTSPTLDAPKMAFSNVTDCVSVDSTRNKAYVAVDRILSEVDLETLGVLSQHEYAWSITALSQESSHEHPLTVGTTWSLNLYDPRVPIRDRSRSPEDMLRTRPSDPEDSIAFFPNYLKDPLLKANFGVPLPSTFPGLRAAGLLATNPRDPTIPQTNPRGRDLPDFAHIEPGPLSIIHHKSDDILIAGRFPSILCYDRRYFPRLQHVIHSGARLSYMTVLPFAPARAQPGISADATLVACGEYGGRGSLEMYSLPHVKQTARRRTEDYELTQRLDNEGAIDREHAIVEAVGEAESPFSYKNRQEASSAKLLSVAAQGTRIVFSDAEGGLKWVERDGRGLARRWNINKFELTPQGASVQGEQVVRKIVPLPTASSERGARGDNDLLIWTGEKIGTVTTKTSRPEDDLADDFEERMTLRDNRAEADEYEKTMRRALERQADERRWMTRFRLR